nr:MAG TPA: hypothetical protein [Bacteriophage sp.]
MLVRSIFIIRQILVVTLNIYISGIYNIFIP